MSASLLAPRRTAPASAPHRFRAARPVPLAPGQSVAPPPRASGPVPPGGASRVGPAGPVAARSEWPSRTSARQIARVQFEIRFLQPLWVSHGRAARRPPPAACRAACALRRRELT